MSDVEKRLEKAKADQEAYPLLGMLPVPIRGSEAWERREALRASLGNQCLSFGPVEAGDTRPNVRAMIRGAMGNGHG
jgi:hypothetical protein